MTNDANQSLLLVDDDPIFASRLGRAFSDRGYEVRIAADQAQALSLAQQESPELAVVDLRLPDGSGLDVVNGLHAMDPTTQIIVLTGYGSIATALSAIKLGAVNYLTKPVDIEDLLRGFEKVSVEVEEVSEAPSSVPSLARVEWEHIHRVLSDCNGNVSQAAKLLRIHRRSLQRKLNKYPVQR